MILALFLHGIPWFPYAQKNAQTVIQTFDVRFLGVDVCVELWYNIIKTRDFTEK